MANSMIEKSVQQRAFELFLERGGVHGNDQDDWFRAETELQNANNHLDAKKLTTSKASKKRSV